MTVGAALYLFWFAVSASLIAPAWLLARGTDDAANPPLKQVWMASLAVVIVEAFAIGLFSRMWYRWEPETVFGVWAVAAGAVVAGVLALVIDAASLGSRLRVAARVGLAVAVAAFALRLVMHLVFGGA